MGRIDAGQLLLGTLLVSGLGARRNKPAFRACAGGAVTNGVNVRVAGGLQRWLYHQLEREYDYLSSGETIAANDCTFTETGRRFG